MPPQTKPQDLRTGATLRALRLGVGLSLDDVARRVPQDLQGVSKTSLSDYEAGRRTPGNGVLNAILEVIASEMHAKARAIA